MNYLVVRFWTNHERFCELGRPPRENPKPETSLS